jgi:hypothetical protein
MTIRDNSAMGGTLVIVKCYIWSTVLYDAGIGHFEDEPINIWKVLKYDAREGWRRSVVPIVCEMRKYFIGSRRRGIFYIQ